MIDEISFIENNFIAEVGMLQQNGFHALSVGLMSQYIETLGSFLDKKPFKAPAQSSIRFQLALEKLFPKKYSEINRNGFLYKQLRSNFAHLRIQSQFIEMDYTESGKEKHLKYFNYKTTINSLVFYEDFKSACHMLISMIREGKVHQKKLA